MDLINCCVIDDEPLAAALIASYVERTPSLKLSGTYGSASEAVREILSGNVRLVFLDIEMPQINGMEFAKILPPTCRVIFTTAYDRYAIEGFRVNAIDYLLKPISYDEFLRAANKAVAAIKAQEAPATKPEEREFILVKSEYKMIQLRIADIDFIEGLKDYIKIYVAGQQKPVLTLMSMKAIEQVLPEKQFMRVHRSFIINTSKINMIERNLITIDSHAIPVSETYRQQFNDYIDSLGVKD